MYIILLETFINWHFIFMVNPTKKI